MGNAIDRLELAIASGDDPDLLGLARVFIPKHYRIQNGKKVEVDGYWKRIDPSKDIASQLTPIERANYRGSYGFGRGEKKVPLRVTERDKSGRVVGFWPAEVRSNRGSQQRGTPSPGGQMFQSKGKKIPRESGARESYAGERQLSQGFKDIDDAMKAEGFRVGGGFGTTAGYRWVKTDKKNRIVERIDVVPTERGEYAVTREIKASIGTQIKRPEQRYETEKTQRFNSVKEVMAYLKRVKGKGRRERTAA